MAAVTSGPALLEGVTVLDLTRFLPGALATQLLGDLGADVIKVEGFPEGDYARGMDPFVGFASINRNKRSIHVDFGTSRGLEVVQRLVDGADAFVEVSRPGSMRKFGLDYESIAARKPDIVYCSVSAYGQSGPWAGAPSHGYNMDGQAGLLHIDEDAEGRPFVGPSGHLMPASLLGGHAAAMGICAALVRLRATGQGAHIDASCWDCGVSGDPITSASCLSGVPMVDGFAGPRTPKYAPYKTRDGRYLMACVVEPKFWKSFCEVAGLPHLESAYGDGHGDDMGSSRPEVYAEVARALGGRTLAEWETLFTAAGLPVTAVRTRAEALSSPHAVARDIVWEGGGAGRSYRTAAPALVVDGQRGVLQADAPALGQHTDEILRGIGYGIDEIDTLRADRIIG